MAFDKRGWRIWEPVREMTDEEWRDTLVVQADCLPRALALHEEERTDGI